MLANQWWEDSHLLALKMATALPGSEKQKQKKHVLLWVKDKNEGNPGLRTDTGGRTRSGPCF